MRLSASQSERSSKMGGRAGSEGMALSDRLGRRERLHTWEDKNHVRSSQSRYESWGWVGCGTG